MCSLLCCSAQHVEEHCFMSLCKRKLTIKDSLQSVAVLQPSTGWQCDAAGSTGGGGGVEWGSTSIRAGGVSAYSTFPCVLTSNYDASLEGDNTGRC